MTHDILTEAELASLIDGEPIAPPSDSPTSVGCEARSWVPPLELRRLQRVHECFAGKLADRLSQRLRLTVEITLEELTTMTCGEWLRGLTTPTCLCIADVDEWEMPLVCELHTSTFYPIMDRLLGGAAEPTEELRRPLTAIERRMAEELAASLLAAWSEAWSEGSACRVELQAIETHPSSITMLVPKERMAGVRFRVALPHANGTIMLAIPVRSISSAEKACTDQSPTKS